MQNKKVLLRERKRHTVRRVASVHFAGGEGVPHPVLNGGIRYPRYPPVLILDEVPPLPSAECGTPHPDLGWGGPPI